MRSPLAFDRAPLFSHLENPLLTIETRLRDKHQRFWIWKEPDFFWFWNEDEPDFYGLFLEGRSIKSAGFPWSGVWFDEASYLPATDELRQILYAQLHNGQWARAITLCDPRPQKAGVWRIVWRRHEFALQNALNGHAINLFPDTDWPLDSWRIRPLDGLLHDSHFFADLFWPLLLERKGRLETAFEFLELATEDFRNPIRFQKGTRATLESILTAGLLLDFQEIANESRVLALSFDPRTFEPLLQVNQGRENYPVSARLNRLMHSFAPHLVKGFAFHSVSYSPFALQERDYNPKIHMRIQGPLTAHERLESLMIVRDWLTEHAPELLSDWE